MSIGTITFGSVPAPNRMLCTARSAGSRGRHPGLLERRARRFRAKSSSDSSESQTSTTRIPPSLVKHTCEISPGRRVARAGMPMSSFVRSYIAVVPSGTSSVTSTAIGLPACRRCRESSSISGAAGTP
jgi:hypothetical protein